MPDGRTHGLTDGQSLLKRCASATKMSDYCFSPTEIGSEKEERKSAEKPIIIHIDKSNKLCDKLMKPIQVSAKNDFVMTYTLY